MLAPDDDEHRHSVGERYRRGMMTRFTVTVRETGGTPFGA
jgi:hypothetical protein